MELSMKTKRSNWYANLRFHFAICTVVLLTIGISACSTTAKPTSETEALVLEREAAARKAEEQAARAKAEEQQRKAREEATRMEEEAARAKAQEMQSKAKAREAARKAEEKAAMARMEELQRNTHMEELQRTTQAAAARKTEEEARAKIEELQHQAVQATAGLKAAAEAPKSNLENYSVTVSANKQLEIPGPPGELRVWIGVSSKAPTIQQGMATETKELEAVGETAKVMPFALGINVEPKESICEKIVPSGSEVRFKLIPIKSGSFSVGANVELFDSNDCSGSPVPKSAKSVEVKVTVNKVGVITHGISQLMAAAWKAFLDFWDKVLLLIFALILFLIRKRLFKLFGFKG
jgi:chemotaxis protein histidine kinase CheA